MLPADFDLPSKFTRWRPRQLDAIIDAACSDTRFTILNMPPGTGKSAAYMTVHKIVGGRTLVLTQTKGLQAQLHSDFSPMGLVEIKGQQNYPCLYFADLGRRRLPGCDEGPCHAGVECELRERGCNYYDAVRRAFRSPLVVANYSYWMTINRYADPETIGSFSTIVLDEAHDAADALAEFVRIEIDRAEVRSLLAHDPPEDASIDEWVEWSTHLLPLCRERYESAKNSVSLYRQGISVVRRLARLLDALFALSKARAWRRTDAPDPFAWVPGSATDWIIEESRTHVYFQPVWAHGYAEDYLFAHTPRVLLVSATVTPKDAQFLGIPKDQLTYHAYPSPFKRESRPIFVIPTVRVGRSMGVGEERIWINRIDAIIEKEAVQKGYKGIIHAVSYARAKLIKSRSRFKDILIIHDSSSTRDTVDRFKRMAAPAVLISPSVGTGWDFPYDECRFQIIAKIPFIDNRPAVIQARHKADRYYLNYVAIVALIQMCGRGVRAEDDWCRTYIIDDNWGWFFSRNKHLMPRWFKSSIRRLTLAQVA